VKLEKYDAKWENDARNIQTTKNPNPEMLSDFERIFTQWYFTIEASLEDEEKEKTNDKEAHPKQELEYWRSRMRRLTGISEQLRSKNCRTVYDVLTQAV
jgi:dynein heavy chain